MDPLLNTSSSSSSPPTPSISASHTNYKSIEFEIQESNISTSTLSQRTRLLDETGQVDIENKIRETNNEHHKATTIQTCLNMTKMCIGAGVLALPFATQEGGLIWHIFGLSIVTLWNLYATDRLLKCHVYMNEYKQIQDRTQNSPENKRLRFLSSNENEQRIAFQDVNGTKSMSSDDAALEKTSTFGKLAFFVFGKVGLHLVDAMMMSLMFGIIVAYEGAILGFVAETPLTLGSKAMDAICMLFIMVPLASLSDYSFISKVSGLGTFVILSVIVAIGCYGLSLNGLTGFSRNMMDEESFWPKDFSSFSSWYGIVAFGFGTVPFTFNLQESMEKPTEMMSATKTSLWIVCFIYIIMGELLTFIFLPSFNGGFTSDITIALPTGSYLTTIVNIAMIIMMLSTVPLIIVPFGELVEHKFVLNHEYGCLNHDMMNMMIRICICIVGAIISITIPSFVYIISFIGCFNVSLICYTYPALAHIACFFKLRKVRTSMSTSEWYGLFLDIFVGVVGLFSCILTSSLSFREIISKI